MTERMRITVTGGAGFIGANLCRRLFSNGDEVVVVDDFSTGSKENLRGVHVELVEGSILDVSCLQRAVDGADAVVHLAARPSVPRSIADPLLTNEINITGTLRVLEAARAAGVDYVVVASSSSVYGANPELPKHESLMARPVSPYAVSKLATEWYALSYQSSYGLPVLPLRFFNVFGPLQTAGHAYAAVIPAFVEAALAGRPIPVHGDGLQSRDFTFVESVCALISDAVHRRVVCDAPVNLAFGSRITLLEVISQLESALGTTLDPDHLPPRVGDVRHSQADQTKLRTLFPHIEPVLFQDGLRATIDWFIASAT